MVDVVFPPCLGVVVILQYHHVLLTLMNASVFSLVFGLYSESELKEMKKSDKNEARKSASF